MSGLPPHTEPNRFQALFGRYLYGFKPWDHCDRCFVSRHEPQISPKMKNGSVELKDDLFYLCGVGRSVSLNLHPHSARSSTNVHLAVRPRKGSVAAIGSVYGATFVIEDAQAIPIKVPSKEFPALVNIPKHSGCKMFQFAYQMFDVDEISLTKSQPVHRLRSEWQRVPGIRQDASGCMVDPRPHW